MLKKIYSFLISFCIFTIAFSSSAFASHYIWLVDDGNMQDSTLSGYETSISWWWVNGAITLYNAPSSFASEVSTAVTNWNNSIPSAVRITTSGSDLNFVEGTLNCSAGSYGCQKK